MGEELQRAGEALLRGCAVGLGLPPETFVDVVTGGPHVTRLLHYLPLDAQQVKTSRQLLSALTDKAVGQRVALGVVRNGKPLTLSVPLEALPARREIPQ